MSARSQEPLFIIRPPQGRAYVIWADGTTSGFPDGSVVVNRIGRPRTGVTYATHWLTVCVRQLWSWLSTSRERGGRI